MNSAQDLQFGVLYSVSVKKVLYFKNIKVINAHWGALPFNNSMLKVYCPAFLSIGGALFALVASLFGFSTFPFFDFETVQYFMGLSHCLSTEMCVIAAYIMFFTSLSLNAILGVGIQSTLRL